MDNDGGMFIHITYTLGTLHIQILIPFFLLIHINKTVTLQHKFSRVFFYYFKICDLIYAKLIKNYIVYYSNIIPKDHLGFLLSAIVLTNVHMYTTVLVGSAMITEIPH